MFCSQLQPPWYWFRIGGERPVEPQTSRMLSIANHRVDQQQIRLGRGHNPSPITRDVNSKNWITQRWQRRLRVLSDGVEQPDIPLVTGYSQFPSTGCSDCGELRLRRVLLHLVLYHLVPGQSGINPVQRISGDTNDRLFSRRLRILVLRCDVADRNVIINLPLFHDLTSLNVQREE